MNITGEDFIVSVTYVLFVFATVAPPSALLSAGLTLENIFSRLLGSEDLFFTAYHLRRTVLLSALSFCVPLGYFATLKTFATSENGLNHLIGNFGLSMSVPLVFCGWTYIYIFWYDHGKWTGHPSVKKLGKIVEAIASIPENSVNSDELESLKSNPSLRGIVASIDNEFRRPGKFVGFAGRGVTSSWPGRRIVVTPSWILYSHCCTFTPLCQLTSRLSAVVVSTRSVLAAAGQTPASGDSIETAPVVLTTIRIADTDSGACLLSFDLPANELENFALYLRTPLVYAQGVSLEPDIVQRFLEVFTETLHENSPADIPPNVELERCIGCLNTKSNVAVRHSCGGSECGSCKCRPMWCEACVGRWVASSLSQSRVPTSDWLSSRVPCPTCRSLFCIRDVIPLRNPQQPPQTVSGADE